MRASARPKWFIENVEQSRETDDRCWVRIASHPPFHPGVLPDPFGSAFRFTLGLRFFLSASKQCARSAIRLDNFARPLSLSLGMCADVCLFAHSHCECVCALRHKRSHARSFNSVELVEFLMHWRVRICTVFGRNHVQLAIYQLVHFRERGGTHTIDDNL